MHNQLIDLLKSLSGAEMNRFGRFLEVDSYEGPNDVKLLFNYLKKHHPKFMGAKMNWNYIAQNVFGGSNGKKNNAKTELKKALKSFLIYEQLKKEEKQSVFAYLKALRERGLDEIFFSEIERIENKWTENPDLGIQHLYDIYQLKVLEFSHPNYDVKKVTKTESHAQLERLEKYYIAMKLYWTLCEYNTNSSFSSNGKDSEWQILPIESILEEINKNMIQVPQINLLGQILNMFENRNVENYKELKDLVMKNIDSYTSREKISLIAFLSNISNGILDQKKRVKELFELKRLIVDENNLLEYGYIASDVFIETVTIACAAKRFEWVDHFVEKNLKFIKEIEKTDVEKLCTAIIHLEKKDGDFFLENLHTLHYHNILYGAIERAIRLRAFYELEDYEDSFDSLVISFRSFFSKKSSKANALSDDKKKDFKDFINFTNKLKKIKRIDPKKIKKDKNLLQKCENNIKDLEKKILASKVAYKTWLLEKVTELQASWK